MGLINLLTDPKNFKFYNGGQGYTGDGTKPNLKNLPYGNDRIYNGNSKQPYITYSIDNGSAQVRLSGTPITGLPSINLSTNIPNGLTNLSNWNNDFILRGGTRAITDSAIDVARLTKWFTSSTSPNGLFFVTKQQLLSRTAVRTQTSGILNEGIYSPLNTLLQAGVNFSGVHLNKQGINPFSETGAYSNNPNLYSVKITPEQPKTENRLLQLKNAINNDGPIDLNGIILNSGNINVMSYGGGPGSVLGIGKTNIRFVDPIGRTGFNNYQAVNPALKPYFLGTYKKIVTPKDYLKNIGAAIDDKGVSGKYFRLAGSIGGFFENGYNGEGVQYGTNFYSVYEPAVEGNTWPTNTPLINNNKTYVYNQTDIIAQVPVKNTYGTTQDFRATLRNKINQSTLGTTTNATNAGQLANSLDYNIGANKTIEGRVNLGDPGNRSNKSYANYSNGVQDLTKNSKSVYPSIGANILGTSTVAGKEEFGSNVEQQLGLDEINSLPVYGAQNADTSGITNDLVKFRIAIIKNDEPSYKTFIHFRALLDSISDSYTATWNPVQYLGRGESFYNYNGFTRQLSLSWTVAAQSKEELIPMYKKLNFLASSLAPDYSPSGYMRGNLVQLTIGGYVYEQPGIITGLTYTMEETSPWEIGIKTDYDTGRGTVQGDDSVKELTHIIKVSGFNFIPIHRFRPGVQNFADQNDTKRFIALSNGEGKSYNNYDS
jgi:hypothetical protein